MNKRVTKIAALLLAVGVLFAFISMTTMPIKTMLSYAGDGINSTIEKSKPHTKEYQDMKKCLDNFEQALKGVSSCEDLEMASYDFVEALYSYADVEYEDDEKITEEEEQELNDQLERIRNNYINLQEQMGCETEEEESDDIRMVHMPVDFAEDNTLAKTPAAIENLVSGFNIDIRNSAYRILQRVEEDDSYEWGIPYFVQDNILTPMRDDPAIYNLAVDDYNECLANKGNECYSLFYTTGSPRWKTQVVDKILASESLLNIVYEWIKPELIRVVRSFDDTRMAYLKGAMDHMIDYTSHYNHQAEKNFYNACVDAEYLDMFTTGYRVVNMTVDYSEVANPYRRLETWVYRRVEDKTMSAKQINTWLKRIKKDLAI